MARSAETRELIELSTVSLLITIMTIYTHKLNVVNTAMGALCNISLVPLARKKTGKLENMRTLLRIITRCADSNVASTGIGLMANLASSNDMADTLLENELFPIINLCISFGTHKAKRSTMLYNVAATLSNCSTCALYEEKFIEHRMLETFAKYFDMESEVVTLATAGLVENAIRQFGITDVTSTTSFHLACMKGLTNVFYALIKEYHHLEEIDFNSVDLNGRSFMSYAIEYRRLEMISLLTRCGAKMDDQRFNDISIQEDRERINAIVELNDEAIENIRKVFVESICHSATCLSRLCVY
jgi:hypothetical protein